MILGNSYNFVKDVIKTRFFIVFFYVLFPFLLAFPLQHFFEKMFGDGFKILDFVGTNTYNDLSFGIYGFGILIFILLAFYMYAFILSAINAYNNQYESIKTTFLEHFGNALLFFIWYIIFFFIGAVFVVLILNGRDKLFVMLESEIITVDFFKNNPRYIKLTLLGLKLVLLAMLACIFTRFIFIFHEIIDEKINGISAIKKSYQITSKNNCKVLLTLFAYTIFYFLLNLIVKAVVYTQHYAERIEANEYTATDILFASMQKTIYDFPEMDLLKKVHILWTSFFLVMLMLVITYVYKDLKIDYESKTEEKFQIKQASNKKIEEGNEL